MKKASGTASIRMVIALLAVTLLSVTWAWAKPTTPDQAQSVVLNWLGKDAVPLGAAMGRQIKEVQAFNYADKPAYYVVYLNPAGLVLVPADDLVEPIIGFLPGGTYDPSPTNPLGALVSRDIPGRVLKARELAALGVEALAAESPQAVAQRKWAWLEKSAGTGPEGLEFGLPSISDVRVAPFVQSRWSQTKVGIGACYNYYTPKYGDGNAENYPCGCTATAMAQILRYWQYPDAPVVSSFSIKVDNVPQSATIRGGNGAGGPYDWGNMVLDPLNSGVNDTQRQAIGALTYDAGVSVNMNYASGASGAWGYGYAFVNTFKYSNGKFASNGGNNFPESNRNAMINPNLDARHPVIVAINGSSGGHSVVGDGYGYNSSTMYHHLNLGWAGSNDAWYNLPTVDTSYYSFNSVYGMTYNVFVTGTGEIIAGRVTTSGGTPLSEVAVTATGTGGGSYDATTDANGIYAVKVPSASNYTVSAAKTGYNFNPQDVSTATSSDNTVTTGNVWGVDFQDGPILTLNQALDNDSLSFTTSGDTNWFPETVTWYYGGSAAQSRDLSDYQSAGLQTTVVGPGTLTFYWQVSSEPNYDYLKLFLDGTEIDKISGTTEWAQKTLTIPAGIHIVLWQYSKDSSVTAGSDCGWVDRVVYTQTKSGLTQIYELLLLD